MAYRKGKPLLRRRIDVNKRRILVVLLCASMFLLIGCEAFRLFRPPPPNQPPVAVAGPDQTVDINTVVTFDGSGSYDPDGDALSFQWLQTAGPTADLSSASAEKPAFTPTAAGTYTFRLVVSDGKLESVPDSVAIIVQEPPDSIIYQEYFSSSTGTVWLQTESATCKHWIGNGSYNMSIKCSDGCQWAWVQDVGSLVNFQLDVETYQVAGVNTDYYGIVFRLVDNDNFYCFQVRGGGHIFFRKRINGDWVTIVPWQECISVQKGQGFNQLTVVADGNRFTFYVNNEQVLEHTDNSFASGYVGLIACSYPEPGTHIAYDNFVVRLLK